jgi:hypothetical protein
MKGRLFMFCTNCGNDLEENAYVCINCGALVKKRSDSNVSNKFRKYSIFSIFSVLFGIIGFILSILLFFNDISTVGMYVEIYDRIFFALEYSLFAILFSSISLILSLIEKKNNFTNIAYVLSFLSFFFIITEIIVVVIY